MTIGIYKLDFPNTTKVYIGQSRNILKRISEHISSFKNRTAAKKLLAAYDTYGIPTYTLLCECATEELIPFENEAIEIYNAYNDGFNTFRLDGGSMRTQSGLSHSNSKYSKREILKVFSLLYRTTISYAKISSRLGLSIYLVNNIASGNHHLWLREEYPDKFNLLISNKVIRKTTNLKTLKEPVCIQSPTGKIFTITNVAEFCRSQLDLAKNLTSSKSSIAKVLKGSKRSHLGWVKAKEI
ncbi:MAG: GIY-YIG nuclease family protein [Methylococcales bacterium]